MSHWCSVLYSVRCLQCSYVVVVLWGFVGLLFVFQQVCGFVCFSQTSVLLLQMQRGLALLSCLLFFSFFFLRARGRKLMQTSVKEQF